jgi:membrane-associated phospholipid phosphatase
MNNEKMRQCSGPSLEANWMPAGQFDSDVVVLPAPERAAFRVWRTLKKLIAEAWAACGAFEWMALGYLGVSSFLISVFAANLAHPWRLLATQAIVAMTVLMLCGMQARTEARAGLRGVSFTTRWWHFWRHWYPHLFFLFCFEELAHLMTLFTPRWQDAKLIAFDYWLTGVHPSLWLEQFTTLARNEFMQLVYFSYFTYLVILGGILYVRREWRAYWSVMTYSMVGYMTGYVIAMFFPIESPWFAMAGAWRAPLAGGPVTAMVNFIEHFGRVRGAAFPSEHVAGAVAAMWGAWKFRRRLFWVLLPVFLCMCVSTVWGRYHYIADVFGGMATGSFGYVMGSWIMQRHGAIKTAAAKDSPFPAESANRGVPLESKISD